MAAVLVTGAACRRMAESYMAYESYAPPRFGAFRIPVPHGRDGEWLAGDFHCHVAPPDDPADVSNTFDAALAAARRGGLDFVLFVPHVRSRFYADPSMRARVADAHRKLSARAAAVTDVVVIPGVEYTDYDYGHIGVSFVDIADTLASPEPFFEAAVRRGGILNIHHPGALPFNSFFRLARANMSWRPFSAPMNVARGDSEKFPREIETVNRLFHAIELYNVPGSFKDRVLGSHPFEQVERVQKYADREAERRGATQPVALVGGSDNHGDYLRATTYLFAKERTAAGIAKAVREGRTCVRTPAACSLQVRSDIDRAWHIVGDEVRAKAWVEARWRGTGTLTVDGRPTFAGRGPHRWRPVGKSRVRLTVARSWSSNVWIRSTE